MDLDEYRRMAEVEDAHWWYRATRALLREQFAPLLVPGSRVLDAGCGTGATGGWLADHGRYVGVDTEALALRLHRERHGRVHVAQADVAHLPFASGSFDAALCVTVLYHRAVTSPADAVRELARVVRPGGLVGLLEPGVRRLHRAHDEATHGARRFSRRDLTAMMDGAGIEVVRATGAYTFLIPPAAVKSAVERGRAGSDLDAHASGLGGLLGRAAALERRWLRHHRLPVGLSVLAVGRVR